MLLRTRFTELYFQGNVNYRVRNDSIFDEDIADGSKMDSGRARILLM